ncbi:MAG: ATP-grasp domain-containing protein [Gammaproteobacteria bacterium]|nr:ATP-grasp domain-containing protein [Gammaproteobacteria bacterium]
MKNIVVVDGYSSGKFYVDEFKKKGCQVWHVQSHHEIYSVFAGCHVGDKYDNLLIFDGTNYDDIIAQLKMFGPDAVIAGTESGVMFADKINQSLGLKNGNDFRASEARRNKFLMTELAKAAGLDTIRQCKTDNLAAGLAFAKKIGFPVVVKEVDGAGGHGFAICRTEEAFSGAFAHILSSSNPFDKGNTEVLVQEFVQGDEYAVNSVSKDGRHFVTEVVKYKKREEETGGLVYQTSTLQAFDEVNALGVIDYVYKVLTALGIQNGPAHTEVMVTPDGRCLLIESGARLAGGSLPPSVMEACLKDELTQMSLSVSVYLGEDNIESCFGQGYGVVKYLRKVFGISTQAGDIEATTEHFGAMKTLPSYLFLNEHFREKMAVTKTRDFSPTMTVYLTADTMAEIERDTAEFRRLEDLGFFVLKPPLASQRFLGGVTQSAAAGAPAGSASVVELGPV